MAANMAVGGFGSGASLAAELARVQALARQEPAKAGHRAALFQLHCVAGAWDKAARQLAVMGDLDSEAELFRTEGRLLLACEAQRAELFAGRATPSCLGQPPEWLALLVEALRLDGAGKHAEAKALREQAFAQAPGTAGRIDGTPFAWIADADERLGPILETIVNGRVLWIPFDQLSRVDSEGPKDLKDLVWLPVRLTLANGADAAGFVPTRYPGSEAVEDDAIRLARRTDWHELEGGSGSWLGLGQRMLASDAGDHPLLDLRRLELQPAVVAAGDA
jgi:type VI secretion system protein ImpE